MQTLTSGDTRFTLDGASRDTVPQQVLDDRASALIRADVPHTTSSMRSVWAGAA